MNYQEALTYINSVSWKGSVPGLERIRDLLERMGNPQNELKFIHVGGTNGKGSTCAFLSHILQAAGYRVGLFISPFIMRFNERMQVNNTQIPDDILGDITEYVKSFAESMTDLPTEFELNTAIAFEYFRREHCDIVVLEVGMGGELDATNVIESPELVILTSIGLDHTEYLGDTVQKIAKTKAGIIKKSCPVVLYRQGESIQSVIQMRCNETGSSLYISEPELIESVSKSIVSQKFATPMGDFQLQLIADYQKYNLATVLKAVEVLRSKGYSISSEQLKDGIEKTTWPGRFEVLLEDPVFLVDGAHNPQGMKAATDSLKQLFPEKRLIFIFGVLADKEYKEMLDMLTSLAKGFYCVTPNSQRALEAEDLACEIRKRDLPAVSCDCVKDAVEKALKSALPDDVICAVGSLYMIGEIKELFDH